MAVLIRPTKMRIHTEFGLIASYTASKDLENIVEKYLVILPKYFETNH